LLTVSFNLTALVSGSMMNEGHYSQLNGNTDAGWEMFQPYRTKFLQAAEIQQDAMGFSWLCAHWCDSCTANCGSAFTPRFRQFV
jgi:hypothetical protein